MNTLKIAAAVCLGILGAFFTLCLFNAILIEADREAVRQAEDAQWEREKAIRIALKRALIDEGLPLQHASYVADHLHAIAIEADRNPSARITLKRALLQQGLSSHQASQALDRLYRHPQTPPDPPAHNP
jgi:hypothetical protein